MKAVTKLTKCFALLIFISLSQQAIAQAKTEVSQPVQLPSALFDSAFYLWFFLGVILLAALFTMTRAVTTLSELLEDKKIAKVESEQLSEFKIEDNAWGKFMRSLTRSVPIEKEEDVLLHHDYDGIRELDNQLPPWWKLGFYLTILFSVVYLFGYHLSGTGKLQEAEYLDQLAEADLERLEREKNKANFVTVANVVALHEPALLAEGKNIFEKNCAACHKADGGGNVGPNLTDDYWIHGGGIQNVFKIITEGVPAKGMISWKSQFSPKQIQLVASYVLTLHGTAPQGAKEAQGDLWKEVEPIMDSAHVAPGDTLMALSK